MSATQKLGEWLAVAGAALVSAYVVVFAFATAAVGVVGIVGIFVLALCGGLTLAALRLIVTPGGAAITIALIGLYVWLHGGFA